MRLTIPMEHALDGALSFHPRPYFWKLKTMEKLEELGLVEKWIRVGEPNGYVLTPEGLAKARELKHTRGRK